MESDERTIRNEEKLDAIKEDLAEIKGMIKTTCTALDNHKALCDRTRDRNNSRFTKLWIFVVAASGIAGAGAGSLIELMGNLL